MMKTQVSLLYLVKICVCVWNLFFSMHLLWFYFYFYVFEESITFLLPEHWTYKKKLFLTWTLNIQRNRKNILITLYISYKNFYTIIYLQSIVFGNFDFYNNYFKYYINYKLWFTLNSKEKLKNIESF